MDQPLKLIQSKINLLSAQVMQLSESGLFTPAEIERLARPNVFQLEQLKGQKEALETGNELEGVNNIDVNL